MQGYTKLARAAIVDDAGQGLVEYALIIGLVSVVAIAALRLLGTTANNQLYGQIVNALP
ncbi:MAG: Flp family type IVb pilin [Vulcanimicrobiaceae bacterium]